MNKGTSWQPLTAPEQDKVDRICAETNLHPITARVLARRGVENGTQVQQFLHPALSTLHNPFLMKGMEAAVERIVHALQHDQHMVISGDYDVDGTSSTALLVWMLRQCGGKHVSFLIPNRFHHGYGLTDKTVATLLEMQPDLVITVDNGVTALPQIAALRQQNVDVVVTDHHRLHPDGLPNCIVVNPNQQGCEYPFKVLCGCALALKLAMGLRARLRQMGWWKPDRPEPNLRSQLDLTAIATIADVTPLQGENRTLVYNGLQLLNQPPLRPGLRALMLESNTWRKGNHGIDVRTIGFQIAPRLNAPGRLADGSITVELLLSDNMEKARGLARQLEKLNVERRATGDGMRKEALGILNSTQVPKPEGAVVIASPTFHQGVIGILASQLTDRYQMPAAVFTTLENGYKGSIRSVEGIDVIKAIGVCADLLEAWGGHPAAAGCTVPLQNMKPFTERFQLACAEQAVTSKAPTVWFEEAVDWTMLNKALVEELFTLAPFGLGNQEPSFLLLANANMPAPKVVQTRHLLWKITPTLEMMAFNAAQSMPQQGGVEYLVHLGKTTYQGKQKMRLLANAFRPANPGCS